MTSRRESEGEIMETHARTAKRLELVEESATFAVADMVKRLRSEGRHVWDLGGGDPDFPTPSHIVDATVESMKVGDTHYVPSRGTLLLREAIAGKLHDDNGLTYDPAREIVVTPSAKHALFIALLSVLDPGDEVLLLTPSWVSYEAMLHFIGVRPVFVALASDEGFSITRERIEAAITEKSRAILINTPNNPTGRALTEDEATLIADIARERDLIIVADEIYEKILYDGRRHLSLAAVGDSFARTITVNGFSKAFAMTGWRLGYVAAPSDIIDQVVKSQQHTVGCACSFVQAGGLAALTGSQESVEEMREEYAARRDLIVEGINAMPGISCPKPDGAFYVFPKIEDVRLGDSMQFTAWLLEEAGVAVTPGNAFGPGGEGHVRMSFANKREVISGALESMEKVWPL